MKKIVCNNKTVDRQSLADPHMNKSYHQRLVTGKSIDLRNNSILDDLGNGYSKVKAIDHTKIVR